MSTGVTPFKGTDGETIFAPGQSGALSSKAEEGIEAIWQIGWRTLISIGRRLKKGNDKGYDIHNWRKGLSDSKFLRDRTGHAVVHLFRFANGDTSVDDLQGNVDAVAWWVMMMNEALAKDRALVEKTFYAEPRGEKTIDIPRTL